ncbi:hypothetical protein [Brevibacterium picturae]|uniref:Uncharacterized protein n=1 Tax=Brevibacterium picturae TaxID=260553 RepID=A0ABN2CIQ6_9MICO
MNTEQHPHDLHQQRPPDLSPTPERPEPPAMAPEAIQAADVVRDQQTELDTEKPTRGVDWVRPSDLMSRAGGALSRRGIDLQADLSHRARAGLATGAKHLVASAKRLPPLSAFGRDEPAVETQSLSRE